MEFVQADRSYSYIALALGFGQKLSPTIFLKNCTIFFFCVLVFAEFILTLRTMTERLRSANQKQAERYANPVMI